MADRVTEADVAIAHRRWKEVHDLIAQLRDQNSAQARNYPLKRRQLMIANYEVEASHRRTTYEDLVKTLDRQQRRERQGPTDQLVDAPAASASEDMMERVKLSAVEKKQEQRFRLLHGLYKQTDAKTNVSVRQEFLSHLNLTRDEGLAAFSWLYDRGLVRWYGQKFGITTDGIDEVERAIAAPNEATDNFQPIVINYVTNHHTYSGTVGAVQTGANATANVVQNNVSLSPERASALKEIDALAESVPEQGKREQAIELARATREEMDKPAPSVAKVTAYVQFIAALTAASPTVEHLIKMLFGGG